MGRKWGCAVLVSASVLFAEAATAADETAWIRCDMKYSSIGYGDMKHHTRESKGTSIHLINMTKKELWFYNPEAKRLEDPPEKFEVTAAAITMPYSSIDGKTTGTVSIDRSTLRYFGEGRYKSPGYAGYVQVFRDGDCSKIEAQPLAKTQF